MAGFSLEVEGAAELAASLLAGPSIVAETTNATIETSCILVESLARAKAPKKTGRLAGSITHKVTQAGGLVRGEIGPSVQYGLYVETGTRPHWMPKGILPYPVMRAIALRGTRPQPYMAPAFNEATPKIEAAFAALGAIISRRLITR